MIKANSSRKAHLLIKNSISTQVEEVWVLALNSKLELIKKGLIFKGTVDMCQVHPRDIFRFLCLENASSYILAHSHPSGDMRPSKQDMKFTKQLFLMSRLFSIPMIDHIIISQKDYFSFADFLLLEKFTKLKSISI